MYTGVSEYTYSAVARGGRDGEVTLGSGPSTLPTKLPASRKEGTTPEELVAAAWASCFGTTLLYAGSEFDLDLSEVVIRTTITYLVDHDAGQYELARARLEALLPRGRAYPRADEALRVAHDRCPVSRVLLHGVPDVDVEIGAVETADAATTSRR